MKCPNCGSDMPDAQKFCTGCGTPLGQQTVKMPLVPPVPPVPPVSAEPTRAFAQPPAPPQAQPPAQQPPPPPRPAAFAPPPPGSAPEKGKKRATRVLIAVVIAILVLGGAGGGIIIWRVGESNKVIASVIAIELKRSDGKTLDLDQVPLDVQLELSTRFTARFKSDGKGTLKMSVVDSDGVKVVGESYDLRSSGNPQTRTVKFQMTRGSGKPLKAKAELSVVKGNKKQSDSASLECTAVEGLGKKAQFEEAKETATGKLEEATKAVEALSAAGINSSDLAEQLSVNVDRLKSAKTADEANDVSSFADKVIAECKARTAADDAEKQQAKNRDECRTNQGALRQTLLAYYNSEGNFPDSMSDLVSLGYMQALPQCPSGGTYTYQVTDFSGPSFDVICSVHGSL
jgi:hypothetical protein